MLGFESVAPPPVENLKFDRSSSRTEIIDRFILTTVLPTHEMESSLLYQCLTISTRSEISITRRKFDKKVTPKGVDLTSLQHTVP